MKICFFLKTDRFRVSLRDNGSFAFARKERRRRKLPIANCVVNVGDLALFHKAPRKKSKPRWRGPAAILDMDESGATLQFQSQSFKVARFCVRRKVEEKDLPQGSAASDEPMNLGWDMSQPLFAPPTQLDLSETEEAPPDLNSAALPVDEAEKLPGRPLER